MYALNFEQTYNHIQTILSSIKQIAFIKDIQTNYKQYDIESYTHRAGTAIRYYRQTFRAQTSEGRIYEQYDTELYTGTDLRGEHS
jgi:hypothetical protein